MYEDVKINLKKKNKILFNRESKCLQKLIQVIQKQDHRILVLWAFECLKESLQILEQKYPEEKRPRTALELTKKWAFGEIKMKAAKRAILDCHAVCKEINDPVDIARYHAIGQGLSTVHVETHAIGLPFYELTALTLEHPNQFEEVVTQKIQYYIDTLLLLEKNQDKLKELYTWADFLKKENIPNKEKLLSDKMKQNKNLNH